MNPESVCRKCSAIFATGLLTVVYGANFVPSELCEDCAEHNSHPHLHTEMRSFELTDTVSSTVSSVSGTVSIRY